MLAATAKNGLATFLPSCLLASILPLIPLPPAQAADDADLASLNKDARDVMNLSIEELMNLPVTTVHKKEEKWSKAPAAISVVTQEDLRRSGVTSIPDALRLVPGMEVAQVDAHSWAVSSRGFNDFFSNKLLVLMDGRSVYTPLFSGVFWDVQDAMLEDIDRIEVIRGPGASLWGANAVNGVINIISKPARETQGTLITGGGGDEERGFGGARYGGKISDTVFYRVYGKYFNRDDSILPDGTAANDSWDMARGGFRLDWEPSTENLLTLQGDIYSGTVHNTFFEASPTPPFSTVEPDAIGVRGGNILGRWSHTFSESSDLQVQLYYDRTERNTAILRENRDTFDIDMQHRFPIGERNDFIWGAGYRLSADQLGNSFTATLLPDHRTTDLFSTFVQDELTLIADRLWFTAGSKFEHNDFTGFEIQPSGRLSFAPTSWQNIWASVSRAVRTPSRVEDDLRLNQLTGTPGVIAAISGDRAFRSEELLAFELGDRLQIYKQLSLDIAGFYNVYDHLRSLEPGAVSLSPPPIFVPELLSNKLNGETYGVEVAPSWQATDWWRLQLAYTYLQMQLHPDPDSLDFTSQNADKQNPHHQASLHSSFDLPKNVQIDWMVRYVDSLPAIGVPSYTTMDLRLGWRPTKNLEFSIVGRNLLDDRHPEFKPTYLNIQATEVERSFYGKVTWRF